METYLLVDLANVFFRSMHVVRGSIEEKTGMSLHIVLSSIRKSWKDFNATHTVVCLEGRSWRKDFYAPYKRNRKEVEEKLSPAELEENKILWETFQNFQNFLKEKTNCTVLHDPELEADDLISGWIQHHPNDNHVINSTDSDFAQLIAPNVKQYNGVTEITTTINGFFDSKGKMVMDSKTKKEKSAPNPEWILFEKCIRGDSSDNIFSAYPGVREKGSKNRVGLIEAFQDRKTKGYNWNNLMLQRWIDHDKIEHRVIDDYNRNVTLIDLKAQPDHIKEKINNTIKNHMENPKTISQVGVRLMKFCSEFELNKISEQITSYAEPLTMTYKK